MDEKYIVTITRQFGSQGRPIAKKLAERLNWDYYDRDIVDMAAKKLNMPVSEVGDLEEAVQGRFFGMKYPLGMGTSDIQDKIFEQQAKIIKDLASKDKSCIIVGRCSDYVLREFPNCLHIYIYAPYEKRYEVCLNDFQMQPNEAKKMMLEVDKARERYHKQYAGYLPADIRFKGLMIDSSILGQEGTVEVLEQYIKSWKAHKNDNNL